jgi:hypothetical protein
LTANNTRSLYSPFWVSAARTTTGRQDDRTTGRGRSRSDSFRLCCVISSLSLAIIAVIVSTNRLGTPIRGHDARRRRQHIPRRIVRALLVGTNGDLGQGDAIFKEISRRQDRWDVVTTFGSDVDPNTTADTNTAPIPAFHRSTSAAPAFPGPRRVASD